MATQPDTKTMNIFQKMAAVTTNLQTIGKNLTVGYGSNKYKAVGERDVLDAVKPLESQYGIYSFPFSREIVSSDTVTSVGKDGKEVNRFMVRIATKYRFINVDKPEEYIDIDTFGDGIDSGDKAPGKAMTYGDKYALLKAYKISTGEDPDQDQSPDGGYRRAGKNSGGTAVPPPGEYAPPAGDAPVPCDNCGVCLPDYSDGYRLIKAKELGEQSRATFGKCLCAACQQKARA